MVNKLIYSITLFRICANLKYYYDNEISLWLLYPFYRGDFVSKELFTLADRIKKLRERAGLTQAEIARQLGLSRSGVNAWEMGLSVPSTQYVVELAKKFDVSTDYLLGLENTSTISVKGLSQKQVTVLLDTIECFKDAGN